jgi:hypothetical protein
MGRQSFFIKSMFRVVSPEGRAADNAARPQLCRKLPAMSERHSQKLFSSPIDNVTLATVAV